MKIGLLTTQSQLNYGAVLQAFALFKTIKTLCPNEYVETVNYHFFVDDNDLQGEPISSLSLLWKKAALKRLGIRALFFSPMEHHKRRRERTQKFLNQHLNLGKCVYRSPNDLWHKNVYNMFVVGSDQVWRYQSRVHEFCLLQGITDTKVKRISYAASLGWSELPNEYRDEYVGALSRFDRISVREPSGADTITRLLNGQQKIDFCVDPTILFGRDRWKQFVMQLPSSGSFHENYAFVYWLEDLDLLEEVFEGLWSKGIRRIALVAPWYRKMLAGKMHAIEQFRIKVAKKYGVTWHIDAGPEEFLVLLANASFVVANSFHAMMFSLIFSKPMRIFVRVRGQKDLMAPRMLDFADRYSIRNIVCCGVQGNCNFNEIDATDYEAAWTKIEVDRRDSMLFLRQALSDCGAIIDKPLNETL